MGVKKFEIKLSKLTLGYKPGEMISGQAVLELNSRTEIKGSSVGPRRQSFSKGTHVYPFQFRLPKNIPSSCHHRYADILYNIYGVVKRPLMSNSKFTKQFAVMDDCDLNDFFEPGVPVSATGMKILKRFFSERGLIKFTVNLEQGGYVPGEIIRAKTVINNESRINIASCGICLCKEINTRPKRTTHTQTTYFSESMYGKIKGGENRVWMSELLVPSHLPATNTYSSIIKTQYFVVLKIWPSTFSACAVKCPVMIGTKPLRNSNAINTRELFTHHISTTSLHSIVGAVNLSPPQYTATITTSLHRILGAAQLSPPPYTATTTTLHDIVGAAQLSPPPYAEAVHGFDPSTSNPLNIVAVVEDTRL